jgi:hypothetical protein
MKTNSTPASSPGSKISLLLRSPFRIGIVAALLVFFSLGALQQVSARGLNDNPPTRTLKLVADYCVVPGKVRISTVTSGGAVSYLWNTGETTPVIDVDIANIYSVVVTYSDGIKSSGTLKVADELVVNGDFSAGNSGFFTEYGYAADEAGNSELYPEGLYGVGTSGQNYHGSFYGKEHSTPEQTGNFMIVNGSTTTIGSPARQRVIWQQTAAVQPNTSYYFSAQAMNLHPSSPAQLQFEVNGVLVGTIADLNVAPKPNSDATVNISNWVRFYSNPTWNSGAATTAVIRIINLNTEASGNDFGLDDISFSTLAPFIRLVSAAGTDAQTTCMDAPITPIVYSIGSDSLGHSILNLPPGITASFEVPNYVTLSGTPTAAGLYTYTITTTGTCNPVSVTGTMNIPSIWNTWTGSVSTDWSNANNWSCGTVPTAITNAKIPTGVTNMPKLSAASVCKMLDLQTSTSLSLNGYSFINYGGVIGTGKFRGSSLSNLTIDAPGTSSTIKFSQTGSSNALNELTILGSNTQVTLGSKLAIYGVLAPQNGNLTISDTLTLKSTSTATARVDAVTGALSYDGAGKVTVERYFPARRSWRLVTSPLAKSASIFDSWQNGGKYSVGKGTYVSGASATNPVCENGLDWSPQNNASLKVNVNLAPVTNTRVSLSKNLADSSDNIGYFIFVRGDRDPANTSVALSNNTTLSSTGKLQTGKQVFTASSSKNGFTFIGNPYASPVDFDKVVLNNIKSHFWVWDPYLNTEQGGFILVEKTSPGVYQMIPNSPGGLNQVLQSSQAFFVETATAGPASVTFQESAKLASSANLNAFRPMGSSASFRSSLYHLNEDSSTLLLDGVLALFDSSFNKAVDEDDVLKQNNPKEMLSLLRDSKTLALERRPAPTSADTLFLKITKTTKRKYSLAFEPTTLDPLLTAFLEDSYTGQKTVLSTSAPSMYNFEINTDSASAAATRFKVLFKLAETLPLSFRSISARKQDENVAVEWTVANELDTKSYDVERSADGVNFKSMASKIVAGSTGGSSNYQWIDQSPLDGNNYYRVRSNDRDGKTSYTRTVLVKMGSLESAMAISPNPVTGNTIGLTFRNQPAGIYQAVLINAVGQTMLTKSFNHVSGNNREVINTMNLVAGVYQLQLTGPDQHMVSMKLIAE